MSCRRLVVALVVMSACTSMQEQYTVRRSNISCDEANRYAYRSMQTLGYDVTDFQVASVGERGGIKGVKHDDHGGTHNVHVSIDCEPKEVVVAASEEQFLKQDLTFTRGFYLSFTSLADHGAETQEWKNQQSGGTAERRRQGRDPPAARAREQARLRRGPRGGRHPRRQGRHPERQRPDLRARPGGDRAATGRGQRQDRADPAARRRRGARPFGGGGSRRRRAVARRDADGESAPAARARRTPAPARRARRGLSVLSRRPLRAGAGDARRRRDRRGGRIPRRVLRRLHDRS